MKLSKDEKLKLIKIYKERYVTDLPPVECDRCYEDADFTDTAAGENMCNKCFENSFDDSESINFLIRNTN